MRNFTYHNPTKIIFGKDTIKKVGREISGQGIKKVLLVCGMQSIFKNGVYDQVSAALHESQVDFVCLKGVQPNPVLSKVQEGIELIRGNEIGAILAVGGGSVYDSAKAIAAGARYDGDVWDIFEGKYRIKDALPIFGILTVSATGSEMNGNAVITNAEENKKWAMYSNYVYPQVSIIDPEIQANVSEKQTINGAVDILSHVFELYFDGSKNVELMQEYSEGIIRTVMKNVKVLLNKPSDYDSRAELAWAATLALNSSNGTGRSGGDWATHGIEHSLSAFYDAAHGAGLAVLTPAWMRYVYKEDIDTFVRFADKIFGINQGPDDEKAVKGIENLQNFFKDIGAPLTLKELGVKYEDLEKMAENAVLKGALGTLKRLDKDDVLAIYKLAYE